MLSLKGGLAQLARALAWHARGHEFDSRILHPGPRQGAFLLGGGAFLVEGRAFLFRVVALQILQISGRNGDQRGGFGAEATASKRNGDKALFNRQRHLFRRKIALGTY